MLSLRLFAMPLRRAAFVCLLSMPLLQIRLIRYFFDATHDVIFHYHLFYYTTMHTEQHATFYHMLRRYDIHDAMILLPLRCYCRLYGAMPLMPPMPSRFATLPSIMLMFARLLRGEHIVARDDADDYAAAGQHDDMR